MDELAPGSGNTFRDFCQNAEPALNSNGFIVGPWGDAIGAAVAFEKNNSDFSKFSDAPVGQVLACMGEQYMEAGEQTEQAYKSGALPLPLVAQAAPLVQGQVIGAPMQVEMGTPLAGGMGPHLDCLAQHQKIEVKEKASFIEALTAAFGMEFEMANKYQIFNDGGTEELFYAVEKTDCCTRNAKQSCPDCAPWNLEILHHGGGGMYAPAFHMERPFSCTCLCFNRPTVDIIDVMNGGQKIGSIVDPFACCDLTFKLRDEKDEDVLFAKGGCCQLGLICPLPCGPCAEVNFEVTDAKTGSQVGSVTKKVPGCCKFLFASDVDNYYIDFGGVTEPRWKAMLMGLSIFIDFRYFSDNENDNSEW